jgi:hypothetical protein
MGDAGELIDARVADLVAQVVADRPAWMGMLGQQPADDGAREGWLRSVAVVAAYRDQYRVVTDDPRQVLGPYPQKGRAGHNAYWHAAESVLRARRAAGLDHPEPGRPTPGPAQAQVARDIYLNLPEEERAEVAAAVAAEAGVLWLGDHDQPDDDAAQAAYATLLTAELVERGHLTPRTSRPTAASATPADEPIEADFARRAKTRPGSTWPTANQPRFAAEPVRTPSAEQGRNAAPQAPMPRPNVDADRARYAHHVQ